MNCLYNYQLFVYNFLHFHSYQIFMYFVGNCVRKIFEHLEDLAEVTNIPIHVLEGLKNVWIAIRCKFYLDVDQLHDFVQKVKADWRAAIPWYPLVPTAHKVMKNGDFDENSVKSYSLHIFIAN